MPSTTTNILAIDNILTRVGAEAAREPFALSAVYADAAARAAVKAAAGSSDYVARWAGSMGDLGWRLSSASNLSFSASARAHHPTLADVLAAVDQAAAALLAAVEQRAGATSEGLDWWWDWVIKEEGALSLGFAACDDDDGRPSFTASFFTVPTAELLHPRTHLLIPPRPVDTSTWAALLVPLAAAPSDLGLRQFTATLDPDRFAAGEPQLRAALGQKFAAHYQPVA